MELLGIIPARGGSKGIPKKNLQLIDGKPLIQYSIDAAKQSGMFERIIVSSDDEQILNYVRSIKGIDIPFKRPAFLAEDNTPIVDVLKHLFSWLQTEENYKPDAFMLLEPTCPFRNIEDICGAKFLFEQTNNSSLLSVSEVLQHPSDMIYKENGNWHYCFNRIKSGKGRQEFKESFFINGAIYLTKMDFFLETNLIYDLDTCEIYLMPLERSFDIDTPFQLNLSRAYFYFNKGKQVEFYE